MTTRAPQDFARMLGIEHPIVLGPFGGLSSADLTATVSEAGGLGSYGLYGYDAAAIREVGRSLRAATDRPFAVNLWLPIPGEPEPSAGAFQRSAQALRPLYDELGVPVPSAPPTAYLPPVEEQWEAVLAVAPAAVSVVYGVPSAAMVRQAHERGIAVIGTATTVAEAVALEEGGVDAVVATGSEAAGHRVSFLRSPEESLVGTFALVPQVADAVTVPVIAAGGIADRRGVAAAFALGADAVQVGTAFLRTRQSAATDAHRAAIAAATADGTVLTRAMSGRLARGIRNRAIDIIEASGDIAPFPAQNWLTGRFRAEAGRRGIGELSSLWAGQASPLATRRDAREVVDELVAGLPAA